MTITVYTTPNCVQCDSTKRMFDKHNVEYTVVDLSQDAQAMEMVREMGYTAAPVVITDTEHWSGFRIDRIKTAIAKTDLEKGHNG